MYNSADNPSGNLTFFYAFMKAFIALFSADQFTIVVLVGNNKTFELQNKTLTLIKMIILIIALINVFVFIYQNSTLNYDHPTTFSLLRCFMSVFSDQPIYLTLKTYENVKIDS